MEFGWEILILMGVPMTGFKGVAAEDATAETSTGFTGWREDVATAEVKTGFTVWIAVSPDAAVVVVRTDAAGRREAVTTAEAGTGFTVCREAVSGALGRTGFVTGEAATVAEAGAGFITGREFVATAEAATAAGVGAEVQVETASWVGAGCCIHCWIKLWAFGISCRKASMLF